MIAPAVELQKKIYTEINNDAAIMTLLTGVYDQVPREVSFPYVSFGPRQRFPENSICINAAMHRFQIDIWSRVFGAVQCEEIVDLVRRKFDNVPLMLDDNALVDVHVSMTRVITDKDGETHHGIIILEALIEEPT